MKKLGIALGLAAVATFTGCKDPDYAGGRHGLSHQNEVKNVGPAPVKVEAQAKPAPVAKPAPIVVEERKTCSCPPGAKHAVPCACGLADCRCKVEKAPEAPVTTYVVQRGDYLAKISRKFNVTIASIRKANPSIKDDKIRIGQKIVLPGKFDVGEQKVPAVAPAKASKSFAPYSGATKEYVVKSGDTLGAIAYGNGINIRQLKEMNGLSGDTLQVGRKLKVPAEPVAKPAAKPAAAKAPAKPAAEKAAAEKPAEKPAEAPVAAAPAEAAPAPAAVPEEEKPAVAEQKAASPATMQYIVAEGDDMTSVSISFGVSAAVIRELNNLGDNDQLKPGQVIKLPADVQQ